MTKNEQLSAIDRELEVLMADAANLSRRIASTRSLLLVTMQED